MKSPRPPLDFPARKLTGQNADHDPSGLPGAVLYPRSTEDVVRIVKLAAKYAIPIIPYSGGTSLEGHFSPVAFASNPADKDVVEKQRKGEKVTFDDVNPGLAWTLDFAENMNQIIKINGQFQFQFAGG